MTYYSLFLNFNMQVWLIETSYLLTIFRMSYKIKTKGLKNDLGDEETHKVRLKKTIKEGAWASHLISIREA